MALFIDLLTTLCGSGKVRKACAKILCPCKVLEQVGKVAYRLKLPPDSSSMSHVSLLNEGEVLATTLALLPLLEGKVVPTPQAILRSGLNRGHNEVLVHGLPFCQLKQHGDS